MRNTYVAEDYNEAMETARPGYDRLFAWASDSALHIRSNAVTKEEYDEADAKLDWLEFQIKIDSALVGDPESVAAQVQRLVDFGCPHLALFLNIPGLGFERVQKSLRLFAEEVIPRVNFPDNTTAGIRAAS